jgi:hypothetical protein
MPLIALLFMVLNLIAFVGAGLWLAVLGYWKIVFLGIALGLSGAFFVSVLLAPSLLLIAPLMSERVSNSRMAALPIAALSLVYTYAVMGIWALTIFWFFSGMAAPAAALPVVLWSYSTATGVWIYMAQKEAQSGNEYSTLSAFFNQVGCAVLMGAK